jgi:hypothetical protein
MDSAVHAANAANAVKLDCKDAVVGLDVQADEAAKVSEVRTSSGSSNCSVPSKSGSLTCISNSIFS